MNYKILIGSIIAVVILVLVSTTSAVNVNISGETGLVIEGPTHGRVGYPLTYGFLLTGQEGCDIWYYVDWDDGTNPVWLVPYEAGEIELVAKTWYECGIYNFLVQVEGCDGTMYSGTFEVTIIDNHPPGEPEICGQTRPIVGVEYEYTFNATDPDGDDVSYYIDWGDDTSTGWIGPFPSGVPIHCSHAWYEKVNYLLRCKAKDIWNCESDWSSLIIWRSKNQLSQNIWLQLLCEKLPLLYRLVHILGW